LENHFAVAVDGPSGAGKSTLARAAAERFGFLYVDTGAIYRTVGLAARRAGIPTRDAAAVSALLPALRIALAYDEAGAQRMYLDGEDVSAAIRAPEISLCASDVSALPAVRDFLMETQRSLARTHDVIMDGRDIGTVVLPQAQLKVFLTASAETRAARRCAELLARGVDATPEQVLHALRQRDEQDTNRAAAPLRAAPDAVLLDTGDMTLSESVDALCALITARREDGRHE
jgi:cytidylate kinase